MVNGAEVGQTYSETDDGQTRAKKWFKRGHGGVREKDKYRDAPNPQKF